VVEVVLLSSTNIYRTKQLQSYFAAGETRTSCIFLEAKGENFDRPYVFAEMSFDYYKL